MWFIASKVLMTVLLPPAGLLLLLLAGLALSRKHPGCGRLLVFFALLLLYLLSLPLAADLLIRPLESAAAPFAGNAGNASAVVVLGGGVQDLSWASAPPGLPAPSLARLVTGVELARRFRLPLVVSGGSGAIDGSSLVEADAMADQAVRLGVPASDIIIESTSRNTRENAQAVRKLLGARTIILVTSAFHMRRAAGMFKKEGFSVLAAPAGFLSQTRPASWTNALPGSGHLDISSRAVAEYLSLAWYRLNGAL